jgi:phosphohistidine phosphatase SixA
MQRRRATQTLLSLTWAAHWHAQAQASGPDEEDAFWALLRQGGVIVLMRHAKTVAGTGDPPGFKLNRCDTQRLLSDSGKAQAASMGKAFRELQVRVDEVRSSAWCRCVDTAELAFGRHTVWPPINSFFQQGDRERQTAEAMQALRQHRAPGNLVLVTHQVNITALSGAYPAMGEVLLTRVDPANAAALTVLARRVF